MSTDMHGIPPNCDIYFDIDVELITKPIFISSYRMAPAKLNELKEQL